MPYSFLSVVLASLLYFFVPLSLPITLLASISHKDRSQGVHYVVPDVREDFDSKVSTPCRDVLLEATVVRNEQIDLTRLCNFFEAIFRESASHPEFNFSGRVKLTLPSKLNPASKVPPRNPAVKKVSTSSLSVCEKLGLDEGAPPHMLILGSVEEKVLSDLSQGKCVNRRSLPPLDSSREFEESRKEWIRYFAKTLLEERLKSWLGEKIECIFLHSNAQSPMTACVFFGQKDDFALLNTTFFELKEISLFGITEWELTKVKEHVWNCLFHRSDTTLDKHSYVLQSISSQDIQHCLEPLYTQVEEELKLSERQEEETTTIRLCSNQGDIAPFYSLYISDSDKKHIREVIHAIAKYNVVKLGIKNKAIRKKGAKIDHLHPLRFLSYVMGEGGLRSDMQRIRSNSWKWNNFIDNYIKKLNKEANANNLMHHVPGFAHSLSIDAGVIASFIERRDWHGLVNYFL